MPRQWPHIRAGLIVMVVAVNLFQGCPVPNVQRRHIEGPLGQREVARWTKLLNSMGWETTPSELTEDVIRTSSSASETHRRWMEPLWPWFQYTQTRQRWSLFPVADPDPWWMHIEVRSEAGWELLYRPLDPEHAFLSDVLEYRRVRAIWNPGTNGPRVDYPRFVNWIANEIFERRSDVLEVRVHFQRYHVSLPGEERSHDVSYHFEELRSR